MDNKLINTETNLINFTNPNLGNWGDETRYYYCNGIVILSISIISSGGSFPSWTPVFQCPKAPKQKLVHRVLDAHGSGMEIMTKIELDGTFYLVSVPTDGFIIYDLYTF